jgi:menaquinol-cytochrome c reductase iron-sulfur subunit
MPDGKKSPDEDRRVLLKALASGTGATFACALAVPAAVFVVAPARHATKDEGVWVRTLRLDGLRVGEPKKVAIVADQRDAWTRTENVELGAVWLMRRGDGVLALSSTCPHLGCAVNANPDGTGFGCPCHTSAFDSDGKRTAGPAPRGMDPLDTRVEDGVVLVNFRTYRIGIPTRAEVG